MGGDTQKYPVRFLGPKWAARGVPGGSIGTLGVPLEGPIYGFKGLPKCTRRTLPAGWLPVVSVSPAILGPKWLILAPFGAPLGARTGICRRRGASLTLLLGTNGHNGKY